MVETKRGLVAIIFVSRRNGRDEAGYAAAAQAMEEEVSRQPGYVGMDAVRDGNGDGITISYWRDEAAALAWRDHAGHRVIRAKGRATWYDRYETIVTTVTRDYRWAAGETAGA